MRFSLLGCAKAMASHGPEVTILSQWSTPVRIICNIDGKILLQKRMWKTVILFLIWELQRWRATWRESHTDINGISLNGMLNTPLIRVKSDKVKISHCIILSQRWASWYRKNARKKLNTVDFYHRKRWNKKRVQQWWWAKIHGSTFILRTQKKCG